MTILPSEPNASRLMSIPTKIDVLNVVVYFVSSNFNLKPPYECILNNLTEQGSRPTFQRSCPGKAKFEKDLEQ